MNCIQLVTRMEKLAVFVIRQLGREATGKLIAMVTEFFRDEM